MTGGMAHHRHHHHHHHHLPHVAGDGRKGGSHEGYAESSSSLTSSAASNGREDGETVVARPGLGRRAAESSSESLQGAVPVSLSSSEGGTSPERRAKREELGSTEAAAEHASKVSDHSSDTSSRGETEQMREAKGGRPARLLPRTTSRDESADESPWPSPAAAPVGPWLAPKGGGVPKAGSPQHGSQQARQAPPLRKGKWTIEEEMYTSAIIREFERGMLDCAPGTTLRSYLSEKLHCDPMRITKKFAGDASIGKRVFTPCKHTAETAVEIARVRAELNEMARRFLSHLQRSNFAYGSAGANKTRRSSSSSNLHAAAAAAPAGLHKQPSSSSLSSQAQQPPHKYPLPPRHMAPGSAVYGSFGGGPPTASAGWRGDEKPVSVDGRGFDAPVVVDHTGALVAPRSDLDAPAPARRRSFDLADPRAFSRPGLAAPPYGPHTDDAIDYGGAHAGPSYRASANNKRYRKSSASNNYRLLTDSLQRGLHGGGHQQPPPPQAHHYPPRRADAHLVESAKEEDSRLLLDFFVKVHERCGSDDDLRRQQQPQDDDAETARVRKRTRASLQQEQQQHAVA